MNDSRIKNEFFSELNNNFLLNLLKKKNPTVESIEKSIIFQIQNNIYNTFIESVYNQSIDISKTDIQDILISLNKMVLLHFEEFLNKTQLEQHTQQEQQPIHQPTQQQPSYQQPHHKNIQQPTQQFTQQHVNVSVQTVSCITESLHIFSSNCKTEDSVYVPPILFRCSAKLVYFELYNIFMNINENNNGFELVENSSKIKIYIPIGNYNLTNIVEVIESLLNEKTKNKKDECERIYTVRFDKYRNRVTFSSSKPFGIKFIDKNSYIPQLRQVLGFDNIDYINNSNYSSDVDRYRINFIHTYDNIYLSFSDKKLNKYKTSCVFTYFVKLNFDSLKTFGENVTFNLNEDIELNTTSDFSFGFYVHTGNSFQRINNYINFNLIFKSV
jgi:hypothetical protein